MALTVSSASHEAVRPDPSRPSARQLSAGGAADGPRLRVLQRACNGLSSTALSSHRHHPCSWPSSRSGRRVSSSANPGVPCGRTASLRATSGRLEHVRDVNRAHGACGWLYPPLARSRSHVTEDHPQPHRTAPSAHDVQQRALMRHHLATAARLPLLPLARESTPVTYCPRPLHGLRWKALGKP